MVLGTIAHAAAPDNKKITSLSYLMYHTPPMGWVDDQGKAQGIFHEMAQRLVAEVDPTIQLHYGDATDKRLLHKLLAGEVDFIYGVYDPRLFDHAVMLSHVGAMPLELWSLPEQPMTTNLDLPDAQIALISIFARQPILHKSDLLIQSSSNPLVKMLLAKRVAGVVGLRPVLQYGAYNERKRPEDFVRMRLTEVNAYLWVSKNSKINQNLELWQEAALRGNSPEVFDLLASQMQDKYSPEKSAKGRRPPR
ncbi:MAG: hypothetical protein AseanaTS_27520 [Candidatus Pelagadaptatus aseana]|uniref:hypothetical protein n=1 Tax=Candidatus Pelagadaptatus aseana TaxID=3120508 RepID=UPI0039B203A4